MKFYLTIFTFILTFNLMFSQNNPDFNQAEKLFQSGDYQKSIDFYQKYLISTPNNSYSAGQIGFAYLFLGQYEQSKAEFTNAIEMDKSVSDYYNGRGLAKAYLSDLESAVEDFTKAIELDPKFSHAYLNRGSAYSSMGNFDYAINDLKAAEKLDNKNPEINYQIARLYVQKKEYDNAIKQFEKSEEKGLRTSELYLNKATVYYNLEQLDNAIKEYTKLLKKEPKNTEALNNRAVLYSEKGNDELAKKDREALYKVTGVKFKAPEEYTYKRISSDNEHISVEVPTHWIIEKTTSKNEDKIEITIPQKNSQPKYKAVVLTLSFNKNMGEQFGITDPAELLGFWQQSQLKNTTNAVDYKIFAQKQFMLNGWNATRFHTGLQQNENSLPLTLYELVTAKPDQLFYGYFQSPADDFKYFEPIFEHIIKSIVLK